MVEREVLGYASKGVRVSRWAVGVFGLSVVGAVLFFLVVPAAVVLVVAIGTEVWLRRRPGLDGVGYTRWAMKVSVVAVVCGLIVWVMMPTGGHSQELARRSVCAVNLRGIMQSMCVYGSDNGDAFPQVAYAPYSAGLNDVRAGVGGTNETDVLKEYYGAPPRQAGSVSAILWQLVLRGDVAPKQFICYSDPFLAKAPVHGEVKDKAGRVFDNFQDARQLSYSVAYPWKADGTVGKWWRSSIDASLPLMSDVAPEQGTGTPAVDVRATTKNANSRNHQGDGQNVAFADAHVEFTRSPRVGQGDDNIFTVSGVPSVGGDKVGVAFAKMSPVLMGEGEPFDVVMVPVRDEGTGGF